MPRSDRTAGLARPPRRTRHRPCAPFASPPSAPKPPPVKPSTTSRRSAPTSSPSARTAPSPSRSPSSPLDGRACGAFAVKSARGTEYTVDIVDASGLRDTCTCPDFLANQLGTCKHLEAVRRLLRGRPALRRELSRVGPDPDEPVLTVETRGGALRMIAAGPWTAAQRRHFTGVLRAWSPAESALALLAPGRSEDGIRIVHAARPALERLVAAARAARRRKVVEAAISAGHLRPADLGLPLFPYQHEGVLHLFRRGRALLADDMGLGKTLQAIAACELLRRRGEAHRVLIVTTATLKHQWAQEIRRWVGEEATVVSGGSTARRRALSSASAYTIVNYELTWRELPILRESPPDVLILDEAQRAKNFRTKTATTLREIPSRFLFILTGTPIENRLDDLYSLLQLVDPSVLGPLWRFNVLFHQQSPTGKIIGYKNLAELRACTAPAVLRRTKEAVLTELPALLHQTRYTSLTPEQSELEEGYRNRASRLLAIAEKRPLTKEEQERLMIYLLKARQACNALELCAPALQKRASPKLDELEALVSEIASQGSSKVLVFSEWIGMLRLAAERIGALGIEYAMLHGEIPTDRRPAILDRFRNDSGVRVLFSTDAGGLGLNLQAATYVIHLDLPWNPARLDQRTARAHRLGQTHGVLVTYLCSETGIERGIEGVLVQKRAVRDAALDPGATADSMVAPSFSVFLRQVQQALDALEETGDSGQAGEPPDLPELPAQVEVADGPKEYEPSDAGAPPAPLALPGGGAESAGGAESSSGVQRPPPAAPSIVLAPPPPAAFRARSGPRPGDRLRLARVTLDAGFPNDAARASYEALAAAVRQVAGPGAPADHAGLVALLYSDLLPSGRVPLSAHGVLARLHDLSLLHAAGVDLPIDLAEQALSEAAALVQALTEASGPPPD